MDAHLTADELRSFARHEGSATDVGRIARHLQSCEECRAGAPQARGLVASVLGSDEEHLTFEQLAAMAEGEPEHDHVARCVTCTRELEDLRQFRESRLALQPVRKRRWAWPAAAAVLLALVAGGFFMNRIETRRAEARLADIAFPAEALAMQSRRLSFRGTAESQGFDVIEPRDTVVLSDRPLFRWNAPAGATSVVEVFGPDFTRVIASPPLTAHAWTPPVALRRGVSYRWQVTAGEVTIPAPPLPEALFLVVREEDATAVQALERSEPRPSLALASAYAKAGDFTRARAELHVLISRGKQEDAATKLLQRIDRVTR